MDPRVRKLAVEAFNLRVRHARAWASRVGLRKSAGRPLQGPWYWVWLRPQWVLRAMPMPGEEDTIDHPALWESLAEEVAAHHGLVDPSAVARLRNLPYAMPRGRVAVMRRMDGRKQWVLYHGNDFQMTDAQRKQLVEAFNLGEQFVAGLVRFVPDEHEVVLPSDLDEFKALVSMPASASKKIKPTGMSDPS